MKGVRIPKDRIGVLIGKEGETKAMIEERTKVKLNIDSEGEVLIDDSKNEDPLMQLKIMDIVRAIGRGFSPHHAMRLMDDDEYFEVINIDDYCGKRHDQLQRVRARVIGSGGKTRRIIEDLTGANLSIYGDTVCIIANSVQMPIARSAVDMILSGSEHAAVYRFLERKRGELRISEMGFS